jgi:hypothetical protein
VCEGWSLKIGNVLCGVVVRQRSQWVKSSLQNGITILSSLLDHFFENAEKHRIICILDVALVPET